MIKDPLSQFIILPDGRRLGYAEFGNRKGPAVFHFHGLPGSRLEASLLAKAVVDADLHLIAVDRPGMGFSDYLPNRRIKDWPVDVALLADSLGLESFVVEGFSGGGPYALSCAVYMPHRVKACGLISSAGPKGIELGEDHSQGGAPSASALRRVKDSANHAWSGFVRGCPDLEKALHFVQEGLEHIFSGGPDALLGRESNIQTIFAADFYEAFRQGIEGEIQEDILRNIPWDFSITAIPPRVPVFLWHGELDANVPICVGRAIAQKVSHCKSTFYPGDGHISVPHYHGAEILNALTKLK